VSNRYAIDEPAKGLKRKTPSVMLTHGAAGDKDSKGLVALSGALTEAVYRVVRFDLPYRTAGRASPPKAELSVPGFAELFEEITERIGGNWVVGGKSYGGRVCSLGVAGGIPAVGLLFVGYPLHPPGKPEKLRVEHWPKIKVPTFFLQGSRDAFCTIALLKKNLPKLGGDFTLELVEGADHSLKAPGSPETQTLIDHSSAVVAWLKPISQKPRS
jgi:predicted alpha/beta-hydrolase family hydrolase